MKARDAIVCLMRGIYRRHFVLPNYTPAGWYECDVFEITKAGYFREYEVKLTRADFKADAEKRHNGWRAALTTKHEAMGDPRGPSQFWFVTPKGLVTLDDVPAWAGLIILIDRGTDRPWHNRFGPLQVKAAPKLHRQKVGDDVRAHARGVTYWRYLNTLLHREALAPIKPATE